MAKCYLPEIEFLRQCLMLDQTTGALIWLERPQSHFADNRVWKIWNTRFSHKIAGCQKGNGYLVVRLNGVNYLSHRLVWALLSGSWPEDGMMIDHENGIRSDNRPSNLRLVSDAENCKNSAIRTNNTSGVCGVFFDKRRGSWYTQISHNGCVISKTGFANCEDASAYRKQSEREYGYHPNHGRAA